MIDYIIENYWLLWTAIAMLCLCLEMTSGDFFLTCIAVGAAVSALSCIISVPLWVQVIIFALTSILSIYFIRPHLVSLIHSGEDKRLSNTDALIDRIGVVSETIQAGGFGRVQIDGDDWKAQSPDDDAIEKGMKVKVIGRDSIILNVESVD